MTQVLTFELNVLKKLTEINFELETLIENPLELTFSEMSVENQLRLTSSKVPVENLLQLTSPERPADLQNADQSTSVLSTGSELDLLTSERISNSYVEDNTSSIRHFSDPDVQIVRDTFKEISQKLGLHEQNLNSMKNFYEKPSTSSMRELCNESRRDISNNVSGILDSFQEQNASNSHNFLIPEKDLNTSNLKNASLQICDMLRPEVIKNEYQEDLSKDQLLDYNNKKSSSLPEESSSDVDNEAFNTTGSTSSSTEENLTIVNEDLKFNNIDECSDDTNFEENGSLGFEESKTGSALEKLNNYKSLKDNADHLDIEPLELPDLKLKPLTMEEIEMIQNFNTNGVEKKKKSMKKRVHQTPDYKIYGMY